jgi:hypothetical protein
VKVVKMSNKRLDKQGVRRIEAEGRAEVWEGLTPEQQLATLDRRLGKGVGAVKQRKRIAKAAEKAVVKS